MPRWRWQNLAGFALGLGKRLAAGITPLVLRLRHRAKSSLRVQYHPPVSDGSTLTRQRSGPAPFGVVAALTFCLVAGSVMIVLPLVVLNTDPTIVGIAQHKQNAESFLYLFSFAVVLPFWLWLGPRVADRIQAGPNAAGLSALTAALTGLLAAALITVRLGQHLPWGDGLNAVFAAGLVWGLLAAITLLLASRGTASSALHRVAGHAAAIWWVAGGLSIVAATVFTRFGHINLPALLVTLIVLAGIGWGYGRLEVSPLPAVWRRVIDVAVLVLILLAVPDMIILPVERIGTEAGASFITYIIQFHQDLWLGAASQVQGGSGLLVDTVSQYGIFPIYLLAGLFEFIPIGNGTIGFIDGFLQGVVFALGFGILRMAGVRLSLAFGAMVVAVIALVYAGTYPIGGLLQHGALRFGLPVLVIAPTVAGFRWPRISRPASLLALFIVGLSSIWALEAFLYVTFSYLGMVLIQIAWQEPGKRLRWLIRRTLDMVAAWVVIQVAFALITLIAYGSLPDWGLYLSYLRDFLTGDIGDLTYDFSVWSRGFGVAAIYFASVIGLYGLVTRLPEFVSARRTAVVALAGLTAYGIALFSYYDNRSLDHVLPYVSLPALLAATIWLAFLLAPESAVPLAIRRFGLGVACLFAALLVSVAWPAAGHRAEDSLLAYVVPGGPSLSDGFNRLWDPPEFTAGASDGERLVNRYMADQDEIAVVTVPDLDVEIVTGTDKPNSLGITDAKEMSWVFGPHRKTIDEDAAKLGPGDLMLLDRDAIAAFRYAEANPETAPELTGLNSPIELVQRRILGEIAKKYKLKKVATSPSGLTVVRLILRSRSTT